MKSLILIAALLLTGCQDTSKPVEVADPVIGDRYIYNDGDPFPRQHSFIVTDVKQGWVRYRLEGLTGSDHRAEKDMFFRLYKKDGKNG